MQVIILWIHHYESHLSHSVQVASCYSYYFVPFYGGSRGASACAYLKNISAWSCLSWFPKTRWHPTEQDSTVKYRFLPHCLSSNLTPVNSLSHPRHIILYVHVCAPEILCLCIWYLWQPSAWPHLLLVLWQQQAVIIFIFCCCSLHPSLYTVDQNVIPLLLLRFGTNNVLEDKPVQA